MLCFLLDHHHNIQGYQEVDQGLHLHLLHHHHLHYGKEGSPHDEMGSRVDNVEVRFIYS
jgi:hypothetical protein